MADNNSNSKKWIVGIQQHRPSPGRTMGKLVKLPDPGTGEMRDYARMVSMEGNDSDSDSDSYIAEFQTMSENFSSFIVGRHFVKDGDLYIINRIDPLFFYLATQSIDDGQQQPKKQSWQPYQQFLEESKLPGEVTECISEEQIQHVCSTFDNDELYFKFSEDRALKWLQKKQERLLESLVGQAQRREEVNGKKNSNGIDFDDPLGGSVSSNFNFGSKPVAATTPVATASPTQQENSKTTTTTISSHNKQSDDDAKLLKMDSLQIICNYLNEGWSKKFMEHLGHAIEEVTTSGIKQSRNSSVVSPDIGKNGRNNFEQEEEAKNSIAANKNAVSASSRTVGNKRLAKVSTKGMKSIGSFFGAGKAKKPKR